MESLLLQRNRQTYKGIDLSEQQVVDCTDGGYYGNAGCSGGDMISVFEYYRSYKAMTESSYPYTGKNGDCAYLESEGRT